jgi:hypothetical protein
LQNPLVHFKKTRRKNISCRTTEDHRREYV